MLQAAFNVRQRSHSRCLALLSRSIIFQGDYKFLPSCNKTQLIHAIGNSLDGISTLYSSAETWVFVDLYTSLRIYSLFHTIVHFS